MTRTFFCHLLAVLLITTVNPAISSDFNVSLRLSAGSSWQTRNDVQIPNTESGSRFSLEEAVGAGPVPAVRLQTKWRINERHGIRVLLAPLSYTENVTFEEPIDFAGGTFTANESLDATYRFNSWRIGYFYSLVSNDRLSMDIGATLKVRDAEIRLAQGDNVSFDDDVGLVPLLYLAAQYRMNSKWAVSADLDGLAGGPGRAIDLGVALDYSLSSRWQVGAELRILDGGADTDAVYNFARFSTAAVALSTHF